MARIPFDGIEMIADVSGGLWLPETRTLVVADLHLEKGSAFAVRGVPLPPYDSAATLDRLAAAMARLEPARVVALGDSFHDAEASARLDAGAADRLAALVGQVDWLWLLGNHDPRPPAGFGGAVGEVLRLGPLVLRHEPTTGPAPGEVAGHLHPKAAVEVRGRRVRARCFVSDGRRVVLPAFGAYAGGLDVFDAAIRGLFPDGFHAYMVGREHVHAVASRRLSASAVAAR